MATHDDLLQSVSRSFYLSIRFLPPAMREPVALGYLLARLTDTIADAPTISRGRRVEWLDQVRLVIQGEREQGPKISSAVIDALPHAGERELVRRAEELFAWFRASDENNRSHLSEVILTILHGQTWDATYFPEGQLTACETGDDLLRYTYWVAGCVGEFWTKVGFTNLGERFASPDQASEMLMTGRKLGQALQLINILRDLHEDLPNGRSYLPADELRANGWDGVSFPVTSEIEPVFDRWLGVCESYLEETDCYVKQMGSFRARFCTRLPMLLAQRTAAKLCEAGAERVLREKVKISRGEVWKAMVRAVFV